jgi:hypothetical protein
VTATHAMGQRPWCATTLKRYEMDAPVETEYWSVSLHAARTMSQSERRAPSRSIRRLGVIAFEQSPVSQDRALCRGDDGAECSGSLLSQHSLPFLGQDIQIAV